jgi:hypothetical protein
LICINDACRHLGHDVIMSNTVSVLFVAAAVVGFVAPPTAVQGAGIVMPLCNGGTITVSPGDGQPGGGRAPPDDPGGCHAACTMTRKSRHVASQPDD